MSKEQNIIQRLFLKTSVRVIFTLIMVGTFLASLLYFFPQFEGYITWKQWDEINLGGLFSTLILISLALQSVLEIFISNFRNDAKLDKQNKISNRYQRIKKLDSLIEDYFEKNSNDDAQLKELKDNKDKIQTEIEELERDLSQYRIKTGQITAFVGSLLGLFIAITGVRVLQPFIATESFSLDRQQEALFHTVDILLTAGLLSGGSRGAHQITSIYQEFTSLAAKRANPNASTRSSTKEEE